MRKNMLVLCGLISFGAYAQDSLKTTTLQEVVVTGTKFELPVEKSGKTIYKISGEELSRSGGNTLADLLNQVPGLQIDGNFGTPGANISYYLRGGRNKNTLVLIDGVPLNDPSAINSEYDLRYIPVAQIESIEVLKGGLSTLYGTNAAAGVISIKLKQPTENFSGSAEATAGSFRTFSQNLTLTGTTGKLSLLGSLNNTTSDGLSAAQDNDPLVVFDKDGFSRQNGLLKVGYKLAENFSVDLQTAYEKFEADYDAFEFTDADSYQKYDQVRVGISPKFQYSEGSLEGRFFYNVNQRKFFGDFPSEYEGKNFQGELIHRHKISKTVQTLAGLNYQRLAFEQVESVSEDSANFVVFDPYVSLLIDLPIGLSLHVGARLNTHSVYGSKFVYNVNPSFLFNQDGRIRYKLFASASTSYITPSLYQLYSPYGNTKLKPEEALNYEAGLSVLSDKFSVTGTLFSRDEKNPIDFGSTGYVNLTSERNVSGIEVVADYTVSTKLSLKANFASLDTDVPTSFYRIPKLKYGAAIIYQPITKLVLDLRYNFTGDRTVFFFGAGEIALKEYQLVDFLASYEFLNDKLRVFATVNNIFDEDFIAIYGYTTRGRNFTTGVRFSF